jgi:hypothetical protein
MQEVRHDIIRLNRSSSLPLDHLLLRSEPIGARILDLKPRGDGKGLVQVI